MTLESQYEFYKEVFPETTYTFGQWKTVVSGYTLEQFLNEKFPDRVSISKNPMTIEESQDSIIEINSLPINKQYYTPNIEDFYKGYEYEFHSMTIGGIMYIEPDENHKDITPYIPVFTKQIFTGKIYRKGSMDAFDDTTVPLDFLIELLEKGSIRVKFLDKEDIESEGWKVNIDYNHLSRCGFEKDNYYLLLNTRNQIPFIKIIYKDPSKEEDGWIVAPEHFQISIQCPSINELRTIFKLLNI